MKFRLLSDNILNNLRLSNNYPVHGKKSYNRNYNNNNSIENYFPPVESDRYLTADFAVSRSNDAVHNKNILSKLTFHYLVFSLKIEFGFFLFIFFNLVLKSTNFCLFF